MTREEHKKLMGEMICKTPEQIDEMCNSGMFNEIIKGYVQMVLDRTKKTHFSKFHP